jgi:hypothetical protein
VSEEHEIDYEAAFRGYLERFERLFGERAPGAFVKFGKHMVQRLGKQEFPRRLDHYVRLHKAVKHMLDAGSTISDALVLDFVEASAWIAVEAPNMYSMFRGELGDPKLAAPDKTRPGDEVTDPDIRAAGDVTERVTLIDVPSRPGDE